MNRTSFSSNNNVQKKEEIANIVINRKSKIEYSFTSTSIMKEKLRSYQMRSTETLFVSKNRYSVLSIQDTSTGTFDMSNNLRKYAVTKSIEKQKMSKKTK